MMRKAALASVLFTVLLMYQQGHAPSGQQVNPGSAAGKMPRFADLKLGVFIHGGIYSPYKGPGGLQ